jgi:hypothetical protein
MAMREHGRGDRVVVFLCRAARGGIGGRAAPKMPRKYLSWVKACFWRMMPERAGILSEGLDRTHWE